MSNVDVSTLGGTMILRTLGLMACAAFAALVGCSSDTSERFGDANAFCSAKAQEECNGVAVQCGATIEGCKGKLTADCVSAGNATGHAYRSGGAETCVNKTKDLFAGKTFTVAQEKDQITLCNRVFPGTTAAAAQCAVDNDCADDLICDKGVCAKK